MVGRPESVMFLLHGYAADARDIIQLSECLAPSLSKCTFIAPDAPEVCLGNPLGKQWFPVPEFDGSKHDQVEISLRTSTTFLANYIKVQLQQLNLPESSAMLLGFSQGAMIALHYALRHEREFAGVIGLSGRLLAPDRLDQEIVSRPPILLSHGDKDSVVPFKHLNEAVLKLKSLGVSVQQHRSPGSDHSVSNATMSEAIAFARKRLVH